MIRAAPGASPLAAKAAAAERVALDTGRAGVEINNGVSDPPTPRGCVATPASSAHTKILSLSLADVRGRPQRQKLPFLARDEKLKRKTKRVRLSL